MLWLKSPVPGHLLPQRLTLLESIVAFSGPYDELASQERKAIYIEGGMFSHYKVLEKAPYL